MTRTPNTKTLPGARTHGFVQALLLVASVLFQTAQAQPGLPGGANPPPPPPLPTSPIATFRHLLSLPETERQKTLAARPLPQRTSLEARLDAYKAMPPVLREERLDATDLFWHLQQLVRRPASERSILLAGAPAHLQPVLRSRLAFWDQLPSADRDALLEHESTLRYLAQTRSIITPPLPVPPTPGSDTTPTAAISAAPAIPLRIQAEIARLNAFAPEDLDRIRENWRRFFEISSPRREQVLLEMTGQERNEMQRVLERFRQLTPEQRRTSVGSFARLASMAPAERAEFLRNAERWSALPPSERQAWRQIIDKLPVFPPLPNAASEPPLPTQPASSRRLATNTTSYEPSSPP